MRPRSGVFAFSWISSARKAYDVGMDAQQEAPQVHNVGLEEERMPVATFRAPKELIDRLTTAGGDTRGGRSAVIREACERFLRGELAA